MQNHQKQNGKQTKKKTNKTINNDNNRKSHSKSPLYSLEIVDNLLKNKNVKQQKTAENIKTEAQPKPYACKITTTNSTLSQTSPSFVGTSSSDETNSSLSPSSPHPVTHIHSHYDSPTNTSPHEQTSNLKLKKPQSQNNLKQTTEEPKDENHPNYTSENALKYLKNNITKQQTLHSTIYKKLRNLPQTKFVFLNPHKFGFLYLNEMTNKIHLRMYQTPLFFTTQEQRRMETYYQDPNQHHSKTHDYANPTKDTMLRCPSPLCHYSIINATNISKHVYTHCFLFHRQTPLIYEYRDNLDWIQIEYQPNMPPHSKTKLNKNLTTS